MSLFVIEVKPKRTWRPLKMAGDNRTLRVTTRHGAASHWFREATATWVVERVPDIRAAGRRLGLTPAQIRVVPCECRPDSLK